MFVYFRITKSRTSTGVAVLQHCMSLLHDEEKRLLHKIDTLTRNINGLWCIILISIVSKLPHLKLWVVLRIILPFTIDKRVKAGDDSVIVLGKWRLS